MGYILSKNSAPSGQHFGLPQKIETVSDLEYLCQIWCFCMNFNQTVQIRTLRPRLLIERLWNVGSTPDAVARRCVLGKDT